MEGDFQLTVLWRSSNGEYPWRIAYWMEEIRCLSTFLSLSLQRAICESNIGANALAKAVASHTGIAFDV